MKRIKIELWSLGVAAAATALLWPGPFAQTCSNSTQLSAAQARAEAADYLNREPRSLRAGKYGDRWRVTDDSAAVWLDERGDLLEVEFSRSR